jgi:ATP-dependent DNA helicase RecG
MIIEAIRIRPEITMKELAVQLDLTIDSIRHHMRLLQNAGVIRHLGSTKAGRWEVKG